VLALFFSNISSRLVDPNLAFILSLLVWTGFMVGPFGDDRVGPSRRN